MSRKEWDKSDSSERNHHDAWDNACTGFDDEEDVNEWDAWNDDGEEVEGQGDGYNYEEDENEDPTNNADNLRGNDDNPRRVESDHDNTARSEADDDRWEDEEETVSEDKHYDNSVDDQDDNSEDDRQDNSEDDREDTSSEDDREDISSEGKHENDSEDEGSLSDTESEGSGFRSSNMSSSESHAVSRVVSDDEDVAVMPQSSMDNVLSFLYSMFDVRVSLSQNGISELSYNGATVRTYKIPISSNGSKITFQVGDSSRIRWTVICNKLTVSLQGAEEEEERWIELSFSNLVSTTIDEIEANMENGMLEITLPNHRPAFVLQ